VKVALLYDRDRLHFAIQANDNDRMCQIAQGDALLINEMSHGYQYTVTVTFTGGIFGSFMQWIIFDFGSIPVLVRKVHVELGTQNVQEKVKNLRKQLHFNRYYMQC